MVSTGNHYFSLRVDRLFVAVSGYLANGAINGCYINSYYINDYYILYILPPGRMVKPTSTIWGVTTSPRNLANKRSAPICPILSLGVSTLASFGTIDWPISWPWKPAIAMSWGWIAPDADIQIRHQWLNHHWYRKYCRFVDN